MLFDSSYNVYYGLQTKNHNSTKPKCGMANERRTGPHSSLGRTSPPRLSNTILQKLRLSPMHNRRQLLLPGMEGGDRLVREIKTWTGKGDDARDIQRRPRRCARLRAVTDLLKGGSATTAPRATS